MATDNGHASEGVGEQGIRSESKLRPARATPVRWTLGVIVRLFIWYALLTPFLRCPSRLSELNESSSSVCKPYLIARSHVEPHVLPYYHTYAAPYVDRARPYVTVLNEQVYTPAASVARQGYDKYGGPAWEQAQNYAQRQWEAQVIPQLQSVRGHINGLYVTQVDPYIQRGKAAVSPYYEKANSALLNAYWDHVFPYYARSRPFIGKTYTSGQDMLTTTVLPYAHGTWSSVIYFAKSEIFPKITGLYSENVEPQLVKIGQRLASYREGKRLRGILDEFNGNSETQTSAISSESAEVSHSATSSVIASATETSSAQPVSQTALSPTEQAAQERERIASDLYRWQEKFASAADKGVEDLEERLQKMVEGHIDNGANDHGGSLTAALETAIENELSSVKQRINSLAESLPREDVPTDEENSQGELLNGIRQAAVSIREHAHTLREWYSSFDDELERRVSAAVNSTLDILDNVRDLGLQEIGIRWAWMDGVTYKDWENYHALKARFEDWRKEVSEVGMRHGKVEEARNLASEILAHAMDAAEASAKELARLKDVGKWKIAAREASDNFDTRSDPPPTWPKPGDDSDTMEEDTADAEAMNSESPVDFADTVPGTQRPSVPSAEDEEVGLDDDAAIADQHILKATEEDSPTQEPRSVASTPTSSTGAPIRGSTTEDQISDSFLDSTRNAGRVAAAQTAPEQSPTSQHSAHRDNKVLDREQFSEDLQNLMSKAGGSYAQATEAVNEVLLSPSAGPELGEDAELGADQYSQALSAASHAVYDTHEPEDSSTSKPSGHSSSVTSSRTGGGTGQSEATSGPADEI